MGITIYLNQYVDQYGQSVIMCRYSYKGQKYIFSTNMKILRSQWDKRKRRVKRSAKTRYATKINNSLDEIVTKAKNIIDYITYQDGKEPTKQAFKDRWEADSIDSPFWHSFSKFYEAKKLERISESTLSNYRGLKRRLELAEKKFGHLNFALMKQEFLDKYIQMVSNMHNPRTGKSYSLDTINTDISNLTSFLNYSFDREWHNKDGFKRWSRPKFITNREKRVKNLSMEELFKIEVLRLSGDLEIARDIFRFMCFSGLRPGEYQSITHENVSGIVLNYVKKKQRTDGAKSWNKIEMNPEMKQFFDKYPALPKPSNDMTNRRLKIIAKMAGIEKPISSSWARHTFINIGNQAGISMAIISPTVGHSDKRVTETNYNKTVPIQEGAKMLSDRIAENREAFIKKLG